MRRRTFARSPTLLTDPQLLDALAALNVEMDDELEAERVVLRQCLKAVTGPAWEVLLLHYWEGLGAAEIATRLAREAGHIRVQFFEK